MINIQPKYEFSYNHTEMKVYHANKGDGLPMHSHSYNHATMCLSGKCIVRKEGKEIYLTKDTPPVDLIGNQPHEIEALEDGTIFMNIFAEGKY